jgi:D-beta-D-heptose 7-phosphate kinase / D-beta-D-heptose 1-phosphate adenosyltransferase
MTRESRRRQRLTDVVESWQGHPVLVVGDAMLDEWRFADSDRLCREAPAPVLTLRRRQLAAGGAANTAVNLAALGARPTLVAPIGADVPGDELRDCLDRAGVRDHTITRPGWATPVKRRLLAGGQIVVREDEGSDDDQLTPGGIRDLIDTLSTVAAELRAAGPLTLVVCDYGLGALPEAVRAWLIANRDDFDTVALDAHDLTAWHGLRPTVVTPSFAEATRLLGEPAEPLSRLITATGSAIGLTSPANRTEIARNHLDELRERTGAEVVAVTVDVDGTVAAGSDGQHRSHATPVPPSRAVGAGDAYLAAMTLALANGATVPAATHLAQLAATVTVSDTGTCVCDRRLLLAALRSATPPARPEDAEPTPPSLLSADALVHAVARHRAEGGRIVFTNGCFDVLHRGHVRYLSEAKALGDVLVVAVNSDESVRRLKGPERPVNPVEDRVEVLAALSCVDYVVVFEEDSPASLIEAVRPDVYVKGGDYPPEMVPEAPLVRRLGGEVRTLGYVPDRSTSAIIERIRAQGAGRRSSAGDSEKGPSLSERRS